MVLVRFRKIKRTDHGLVLEYEGENKGGSDSFIVDCNDEPVESFIEALQTLKSDVINICELSNTGIDRCFVKSISMSYKENGTGITITMIKVLERFTSPLVINTPHVNIDEYGGELGEKMRKIEVEALEYLKGNRVQLNLFKDAEYISGKPKRKKVAIV